MSVRPIREIQVDRAACYFSVRRQDPENALRESRLPTAGLADEAERLVLADAERDVSDRIDRALIRAVLNREVVDIEQTHVSGLSAWG